MAAAGAVMASLTGCGTQAKATDAEMLMETETIVVAEDNIETEEADTNTEETETNAEAAKESEAEPTYSEHEYFYAVEEIDWQNVTEEIDMNALVPFSQKLELDHSLDLYHPEGILIGYTKPEVSLEVLTYNEDWYCVEFVDEEEDFRYLLVKTKDVENDTGAEAREFITQEDVAVAFNEHFSNAEKGFSVLDAPSSDMEFMEFSIPVTENDLESRMYGWEESLTEYSELYIEPMERDYDNADLWFKVYYKGSRE